MDKSGKISHVLLSFAEYQRLIKSDLTDDQMLSKINREIAYWKAFDSEDEEATDYQKKLREMAKYEQDFCAEDYNEYEDDEEEEKYYLESVED